MEDRPLQRRPQIQQLLPRRLRRVLQQPADLREQNLAIELAHPQQFLDRVGHLGRLGNSHRLLAHLVTLPTATDRQAPL